MSNQYDYPTDTPLVGDDKRISSPWGQWVSRTHRAVMALQQSGTTADRPTAILWIGRTYFDTTLNKPIWVQQVKPAIVWCDATGAAV